MSLQSKSTIEKPLQNLTVYRNDAIELVDVMQLEEDSKLNMNDRSRQIADIISDIESKLEDEYRS
ncbi:LOW QUALITY PROTEIN: hypothetical protein AJ78_08422 [Emergomyces pasteurianus Ep9510]|uniref:Uncharacterized protein n=1 Tax=Emergomyces pasteurianus Ep9510 TaxID=1447872 RepID=A0A1J9Q3W1_9EURO|nr:LOW QUALITY PROTEIN: hypothetical protein AJ78_08422 [Emergomyces pasteurianus Ep9510]